MYPRHCGWISTITSGTVTTRTLLGTAVPTEIAKLTLLARGALLTKTVCRIFGALLGGQVDVAAGLALLGLALLTLLRSLALLTLLRSLTLLALLALRRLPLGWALLALLRLTGSLLALSLARGLLLLAALGLALVLLAVLALRFLIALTLRRLTGGSALLTGLLALVFPLRLTLVLTARRRSALRRLPVLPRLSAA